MKIQLQFDLGEIRWSARHPLAECCRCRTLDEGKAECKCGTVFFQVLPDERAPGKESLEDLSREVCC